MRYCKLCKLPAGGPHDPDCQHDGQVERYQTYEAPPVTPLEVVLDAARRHADRLNWLGYAESRRDAREIEAAIRALEVTVEPLYPIWQRGTVYVKGQKVRYNGQLCEIGESGVSQDPPEVSA